MILARWQDYWQARSARERLLLALAGTVLLFGIGYGLVAQPLWQSRAGLEKRLPQLRADTQRMRAQASGIEQTLAARRGAGETALIGRVTLLAGEAGLRETLDEMTPLPDGRVHVAGRAVPVQTWLKWLVAVEGAGLGVSQAHMVATGKPGEYGVDAIIRGDAD